MEAIIQKVLKDGFEKNYNLLDECESRDKWIKKLGERIDHEYFNGNSSKALTFTKIILYLNLDYAFDHIKLKLKIFHYNNNDSIKVTNFIRGLIDLKEILNLESSQLEYFKSIIVFSSLWNKITNSGNDLNERITDYLANESSSISFIRTLLAFSIDVLMTRSFFETNGGHLISSEDIISSISTILNIYKAKKGNNIIDENERLFLNDEILANGWLEKSVELTFWFEQYKHYELYINHFDYLCYEKDDEIIIEARNDTLEKSIRLGYINNTLQSLSNYQRCVIAMEDKIFSFKALISKLLESNNKEFIFEENSHDYKRYILKFPEILLTTFNEEFMTDKLFFEEYEYLNFMTRNFIMKYDELVQHKIVEDFTILEYLKFNRVLFFLNEIFYKRLIDRELYDFQIALHSYNLTLFEGDYKFLKYFFSEEIIEKFLKIISINFKKKYLIDLQYQPSLKIGNIYLLAIPLQCGSNTIRNLIVQQRHDKSKSFGNLFDIDKISKYLSNLFEFYGYFSIQAVPLEYESDSTDIDLLVFKENFLFLFEVKQSILPTNPYELRTSYDYLKKAISQINISRRAFKDLGFIREFNRQNRISIPEDLNIIPAIMISNRMFAGFEVDGINVINPFEFSNYIEKGEIVKSGEIIKIRNTNKLPIKDITNFICSDTSNTKKALKSMEPNDITTTLDSQQITFKSFKLPNDYFEKI